MAIGPDGQVRRSCSGRLRIPGRCEPNHAELFGSLREQFGEKEIVAIQPFGMGRFELLFESVKELNKAVERGLFFDNVRQDIEPVDSEFKWLYIKYAPFELDKKDLEACLAPYGEIHSMQFVYPEEMRPWHNGERKLKFLMKRAVPNFLRVGVYTVHIHYAGVVKLCRKCHSNDHMARECNNNNCRKCGKPGHVEVDCGGEVEESESPLTIMKMTENARDNLLKELRTVNSKRVLTLENPKAGDDEEEEEADDTQDHEDVDQEEVTEDEQDVEEQEQETEEDLGDTENQHNLERKKYLKEKEGENKKCIQEVLPGKNKKKKMSKQERKKKRQREDKERNNKREREESKSPTTEETEGIGERSDKNNETEGGENEPNQKKSKSHQAVENGENEAEGKNNSARKKQANFMVCFEWGDMSFGKIKEMLNNNFGAGTVTKMEKSEGGKWAILFTEGRWALQAMRNGIRDEQMTWFPVSVVQGERESPLRRGPEMEAVLDKFELSTAMWRE